MATHQLDPERRTLHGHFSPDLPPVLTIDPGDTVVFRTLNAGWHLEPPSQGEPPKRFEPRTPGLDDGHALCGPVAVRGAGPGMTLVVRIGEIRPGPWGITGAGGRPSPVNARLGIQDGEQELHRWTLDAGAMTARNHLGFALRLRPFMGVMGMPPAEPGVHPTGPPRRWGGNMDCRELVSGSILHLPVSVPLALFSAGDGHGVQADGEVSGTAIECPMERVDLTFSLADGPGPGTAWAETPAGLVTMGFDRDLDEAMLVALEAMLDLMERRYRLERRDATALASLVVDLRVTQVVNGVQGVHALLPPNPFLATP
jgi:acetamidase/formamidase